MDSGRIKALAVTSAARSPALPDVPSLKEAGMKPAEVELGFWFGLFGPKGMPSEVKAKLEQAVATVMSDQRVRERLAKLDINARLTPSPLSRPSSKTNQKLDEKSLDGHEISRNDARGAASEERT